LAAVDARPHRISPRIPATHSARDRAESAGPGVPQASHRIPARLCRLVEPAARDQSGSRPRQTGAPMTLARGWRDARRLVTLGLCTAALALSGCGERSGDAVAKAPARPPTVPVTVSDVVPRDVPIQVRAIGNVQAYATVSVLSLVGGELFKLHFAE